jgi:acyl-CoA oxidase
MDAINYVYENAKTAISEKNCNQKTDESHLSGLSFAFQHRENNFSICSTAKKKLIDSGLDPDIVQHH